MKQLNKQLNIEQNYKKAAVIISVFLLLSASFSLLYLLLPADRAAGGYIAEIYQDGKLLWRIPLQDVAQNRTFTVESAEGGINEIEIRPDGIAIVSADCPDRLCVRQGFISDGKLPITCLPNRLVIFLRPAGDESAQESVTPDMITY